MLVRCEGLYLLQGGDEPPAEPGELRSVPRENLVALLPPEDFGLPDSLFRFWLPEAEGTFVVDDDLSRASVARRIQIELDRRAEPPSFPFTIAGTRRFAGVAVTAAYEGATVRCSYEDTLARSAVVLLADTDGRRLFRRFLRGDPDPIRRTFSPFRPGALGGMFDPAATASGSNDLAEAQVCEPTAQLFVFGSAMFASLGDREAQDLARRASLEVDAETYVLLEVSPTAASLGGQVGQESPTRA